MSLFSSIAQVKAILGMAISNDVDLNDIEPYLVETEEQYLLPLLGSSLYEYLMAQNSLDNYHDKALRLAQTLSACKMLADTYHLNGVVYSSGGNSRIEADNIKTPYKYQDAAFITKNNARAYTALDELHYYLGTNLNHFGRLTSTEIDYICGGFVNTAKDMQRVMLRSITREVFDELRPLIKDMERTVLISTIGLAQYETLLAQVSAAIEPNPSPFLRNIQAAIVEYTMQEAFKRKLVSIQNGMVVRQEASDDDSTVQLLTPDVSQLTISSRHFKDFASRHVQAYRAHMLDNPNDYPEFITWNDEQTTALEITVPPVIHQNYESDYIENLAGTQTTTPNVSGRIF